MKKTALFLAFAFAFIAALTAQITREQADQIAIEYLGEQSSDFTIYSKDTLQVDGITIATSTGELLELEYPCWVYYVHFTGKTNNKYLLIKESNGNVLEINTKNDDGIQDLEKWRVVPFINHSIWKYTKMQAWSGQVNDNINIVLSFYPSINKLIVISDLSVGDPPPNGTPLAGIYDYYIDDNGVIHGMPPNNPNLPWAIVEHSENEMILRWGNWNPTKFFFDCLTNFSEI